MPPEALAARLRLPRSLTSLAPVQLPQAWKAPLAWLGGVWLALIALLHADWADMFAQWWDISTYNHILLIPPIIAWLIHQRAGGLARLTPQAWWPGMLLFAAAAALWLLGALAGVSLGRQLGAVALLVAAVPALLGPRVTAGLLFPLAYMAFLVPAGEELVPPMQMVTAAMTVALVHFSAIPAEIDGVFIDTPMGLFEVAEACSGVMFLIAMLAIAVLAAHVCFRSWWRRAAFVGFALAVPVLANGVRAWGTIFAAQYVGIERAAGFDHIFYGWIFFGLVIAATFAASWRFFDRPAGDPLIDADAILASPLLARFETAGFSLKRAAIGLAAIAALMLGWASAAERLAAPLPHADISARSTRLDAGELCAARLVGAAGNRFERTAFWAATATSAVSMSMSSSRSMPRRARAAAPRPMARAHCRAAAVGPGSSLDPQSLAASPTVCLVPGARSDWRVTWYRSGDLLTGSAPRLQHGQHARPLPAARCAHHHADLVRRTIAGA